LPADFRPYEEATIRLMDHLQTAYGLIESNEMPGENCTERDRFGGETDQCFHAEGLFGICEGGYFSGDCAAD